jgi:hypothetical protein
MICMKAAYWDRKSPIHPIFPSGKQAVLMLGSLTEQSERLFDDLLGTRLSRRVLLLHSLEVTVTW